MLADEYVLTHKCIFGERYKDKPQKADSLSPKLEQQPNGKSDPNVCNYYHQKGHWKKECPLLKEKSKVSHVKSAGLAATIHTPNFGDTEKLVAPFQMQVKPIDTSEIGLGYAPFMSDGFVMLTGSDKKVPVKILRSSAHLCEGGHFALFSKFRHRELCSS